MQVAWHHFRAGLLQPVANLLPACNTPLFRSSNAPFRSAAFGPQPYSHRRNEPLYSFGTGTIEAKAALYLGACFGRQLRDPTMRVHAGTMPSRITSHA